jgi:hypothetical protein
MNERVSKLVTSSCLIHSVYEAEPLQQRHLATQYCRNIVQFAKTSKTEQSETDTTQKRGRENKDVHAEMR